MECIENYIGIRTLVDNCDYPPSVSGLYLEDLEGMTAANLAAIETGKVQNIATMFERLLERSGRLLSEEVKIAILPQLRTEAAIEGGRIGKFKNTTCGASELNLKTCLGALQRLVIESVTVKFAATGTQTITITDGDHTETFDVVTVSGEENTVPLMYIAKTDNVVITCPATGYKGSIGNAWRFKNHLNNGCWSCLCCNTTAKELCGISANFTVQCDFDRLICILLPHIKMPLLYSLGIEVLKEWESSTRLNFLTIHGKEWAAAKREEWQAKRNEMLNAAMTGIIKMLQEVDRDCVICGGFSYGYSHP
jgi:hypothetical protein